MLILLAGTQSENGVLSGDSDVKNGAYQWCIALVICLIKEPASVPFQDLLDFFPASLRNSITNACQIGCSGVRKHHAGLFGEFSA